MGESDGRTKNVEREQRILDATTTLIMRYGYEKTSVSDIAKEAGISKGAVYLHFNSKDELISRLVLMKMFEFIDRWAEREKADTSPKVFASMYRHVLTVLQEDEFLWALFSNQKWLMGNSFTSLTKGNAYQQRLGMSEMLLTRLKDVGAIRQDIDPVATAYVFNMLNYGYLKLGEVVPLDGAPPTDVLINEIGELVQRHLQPEGDPHADEARAIILGMLSGSKQLIQNMLNDS